MIYKLLFILASVFVTVSCGIKGNDSFYSPVEEIAGDEKPERAFKELDEAVKSNYSAITEPENLQRSRTEENLETGDGKISQKEGVSLYKEKKAPRRIGEKPKPGAKAEDYGAGALPLWVLNPGGVSGYEIIAVGSSQWGSGNVEAMKKAARMQAQGELSRIIGLMVENEIKTSSWSKNSETASVGAKDVKTYSRQRSESILSRVIKINEWTDPVTGDYYVLMGVPAKK